MIGVALLVKVTVVLLTGSAAYLCSRGLRPAIRHMLCALALGLAILAPFSLSFQPLAMPVTFRFAAISRAAVEWPGHAATFNWLKVVWLAGASCVLLRFCCGAVFIRYRRRDWEWVEDFQDIPVYLAPVSTPLLWGWRRPVILLPGESTRWSKERRHLALLHELAHLRRRDNWVALQVLAAQSVYWFHPLVWWHASRLKQQQELACDDHVLASGAEPSLYAELLLDISRNPSAPALFCAMVHHSNLRGRIMNILHPPSPGRPSLTSRLTRIALPAILMAAAAFIPTMTLNARSAAVNDNKIYKIGDDEVSPPRLISKVEPNYSNAAREKKLEGTTLLGIVIDTSGTPYDIKVLRNLDPDLDQNAVDAVKQWRFDPATKGGEPVAVEATVEVNFRLK